MDNSFLSDIDSDLDDDQVYYDTIAQQWELIKTTFEKRCLKLKEKNNRLKHQKKLLKEREKKMEIEKKNVMQNLTEEKKKWQEQQAQVRRINAITDDIIDLNVGGVTEGFTVTKSLLQTYPGSYLDSMFSGNFAL